MTFLEIPTEHRSVQGCDIGLGIVPPYFIVGVCASTDFVVVVFFFP